MSASTGEVPGRIFMTYRREDTAYPAAWLFDRLASHFGRNQVFKDIDSIELGDDFVEVITAAVGSCDALLALIGDRWLSSTGRDGQRRLDDPDDFVRLEIEAALARNVRVIPILVEGAQMPRADELPASLARLARRQALELSPARFDADIRRLLMVLDRTIAQAKERARQDAEAAAERRRQVGQLQQRIRDRAAARDWDAVVAASGQLAGLNPAAADPDGLASVAREQIARRRQAEQAAAERRRQVGQLQQRIRDRAAARDWDAVVAASGQLAGLNPAAADPDGLASVAREQIARRRQAEQAAAERRRQVGQLQQRIRDRAAARDWDAVVAASGQLAGLDPAAADPDGLASVAREQIARRQEAEPPAVGAQQPADDLQARRGESPQANAGSQGLTPAGQAVTEPVAAVDPSPSVADHGAVSEAGGGNPPLAAGVPGPYPDKETTSAPGPRGADPGLARPNASGDPRPHIAAPQPESPRPTASGTAAAPADPMAPATIDPAPIGKHWWAAAPAVAKTTSQSAGKPETVGVSGRPPEELSKPTADAEGPASAANVRTAGSARAVRLRFSVYREQLARHLQRRTVIISLAVLLVVFVGGGYIAWRWSQDQYFVGADSRGQVVIFRGVNQRVAGVSLSHPYQQTGILLSQVPSPYQQTVKATDAASSLSSAQAIVANVQNAVSTCRRAYLDRQAWVAEDNLYKAYKAAAALASKQHKKPPPAVANPGAEPPPAGPMCPPSTAFGIAATDLVPAAAGSS